MKNEKGITLLALVVTIIIILILSGIAIGALTGDNGLIGNAISAKEKSEIDNEKEILNISVTQAMSKNKYGNITKSGLQIALDEQLEKETEKAKVIEDKEEFLIQFLESQRWYSVDKDGNVTEYKPYIDKTPGELAQDENDNFMIESIEDLVAFSQQVNGGRTYANSTIILARDLDFTSVMSYCDSTTTKYNEYLGVEENVTLIEALTTEEQTGFIPIGASTGKNFQGIFDGQGHIINNLYENNTSTSTSNNLGFFGSLQSATIKNIKITGKINSGHYAGGLTYGATDTHIYNCYTSIDVTGQDVGGICCSSSNSYFKNCYNTGIISGKWQTGAGGIVGSASNTEIYNSYNLGKVSLTDGNRYASAGGIVGYTGNAIVKVYNCYNTGIVSSSRNVGAIVGGYNSENNITTENCYYLDNMSRGIGMVESDNCIKLTKEQLQNIDIIENDSTTEYIIDLLNEYVSQYNANITQNDEKLYLWKKDTNTGYLTFEK